LPDLRIRRAPEASQKSETEAKMGADPGQRLVQILYRLDELA